MPTLAIKPLPKGEIGWYVPHAFMPDFRIPVYSLEHLEELKLMQNGIARSFLEE